MFKFPLIELIDRYSIARLKMDRLGTNQAELDFYTEQIANIDTALIQEDLEELYRIHARIWDMENDFKNYTVEEKYSLEEVGRRAIAVRNINGERYKLKNIMADKLGDAIKEHKRYGD
jgi:hypothetical protein